MRSIKVPLAVYVMFSNKRFVVGLVTLIIIVLMAVVGPIVYPRNPFEKREQFLPPSLEHPLGTDGFGRDVLAIFLHSINSSLMIGLVAAIISLAIGLVIGAIAGIKGGLVDEALMSFTNIILAIPNWLIVVLIASFLPVESRGPHIMAILLGAFAWPWFARAIRAMFMSLRQREFVALSKMAGYNDIRLVFEDLLPLIGPYIINAFAGFMGGAIAGEAGVAMLLSGQPMTAYLSLGMMLVFANHFMAYVTGAWWLFLPPGLTIIALTTSLSLIGVGLEPLFNPRLRES
ncbi:MAG: ABC transporter permease [Ignisphaera sp.]|uniref:ABC transporter permease n=1 Tax=Ignisphaera aggregans TaxID=334771 RepID=A0A7C4JK62_9CREN